MTIVQMPALRLFHPVSGGSHSSGLWAEGQRITRCDALMQRVIGDRQTERSKWARRLLPRVGGGLCDLCPEIVHGSNSQSS